MLKYEYQDSNFIEIFNSSNKDPFNGYSLTGLNGIKKVLDKDLKTSIYKLQGTPNTTKISIPKEKHRLSLFQRILVFQIYVKNGDHFSLNLGITDICNNRRHLLFSTLNKELNIQPLIARIPFKTLPRSIWISLVFDLSSLVNDLWKNQTFKSIDSVSVCANCKLRKVFTLKNLPDLEIGLFSNDFLNDFKFPKEVNNKTMMISISEETNLKTVDLQDEYMNQSLEAKPKNFFKIAFGSRINSDISSNNLTKYHSRPLRSYNSQLKEKSDLNSDNLFDLKNTSIFPLSMSNKNNDNDLNFPNKTILYKKINETLPKNEHIDNRSIIGTTKSIEDNHDEFSLSKIPHPPPRSSRPISSSVRKIRLPTTIKSQKSNENFSCFNSLQLKKEESCPEIKNLTSFIEPNSRLSNNIVNESINDLINVLKSSSKKKISKISQNNFLSSENFSEITNLDDSGNTIMYSFSSKPKPVSIVNNQIPYLTEKINKKVFDSKVTKSSNIYKCDHQKYSHNIAYTNICRSNEYLDKVNLIDSFEAQMLEEIKAESEISNQYKNSDNTEVEFESKENFNYKKIKSPDIEYFEAFQRGLSNLTNLSEEIQTSGKYNFDALTSSFEETSASYSKKNNNYKTKFDEANNYQEEMNISLLSNLPAKSINLKDNPSKHSPVPNTNQNEPTKIKQEMISEELHFDDSQADIDEISSDVNEEIDLLYDPTLNCYYDPKTCTYYELNLS